MTAYMLYGHTGSNNRGCEAIVRSTASILHRSKNELYLTSAAKEQDLRARLDALVQIIEFSRNKCRYTPYNLFASVLERGFNNDNMKQKKYHQDILKYMENVSGTLVIGGDLYCYGEPKGMIYFNRCARKQGKKTFLWSCSVGQENITENKSADIRQYTMIFPRETLTYKNLIEAGVPEDRLCRMADSAFILPKKEIKLPDGFGEKRILGYNANPNLGGRQHAGSLAENRYKLFEYILQETDYEIALIPHVYSENTGDICALRELYEKYKSSDRVYLFDRAYGCMELKYIISKCDALVAERTHASIAGYSSGIPTFVVGYSVKSQGIALDLFGQTENYVVPVSGLSHSEILKEKVRWILDHTEEIQGRLLQIMPEYIQTAWDAGDVVNHMMRDIG